MIIQRVRFTNYKTYLSLDLDLNVDGERPIILIGGSNGGGKTTLFEGICGALYGLKISTKDDFLELLNNGAPQSSDPEIILEVTFMGMVLSSPQKYVLRRTYKLNPAGKPIESVSLNMNGSHFVYGTATAPAQRAAAEQQVNKIIKANLPQELSKYFLFDAMQSSELLKKNVFAQIIRDNIENVMGFKKYVQLKRAAERLQQDSKDLMPRKKPRNTKNSARPKPARSKTCNTSKPKWTASTNSSLTPKTNTKRPKRARTALPEYRNVLPTAQRKSMQPPKAQPTLQTTFAPLWKISRWT